MKKITEQDLLDLGFKKEIVSPQESGLEYDFIYYVLDTVSYSSLISSEIYEDTKENNISVEIFNEPGFNRIFDLDDLKTLLDILIFEPKG